METRDVLDLQDLFFSEMKQQERTAVEAQLAALKATIASERALLKTYLDTHATELKDYLASNFVSNIEEAFQGKVADRAKEYLQVDIQKPTLTNPIK